MLGAPARIKEIVEIARKRGIVVLEDTAQAIGASVGGKKLGTLGDMGTFSFDYYKTLTTGEGGMVLTNDRDLYVKAAEYADHGHDHNPAVGRALEGRTYLGFNYRMNELQGALGLAQLARLDKLIDRQKENQALIRNTLERLDGIKMREMPENGTDSHTHICFFLENREKAMAFHKRLTEKGIPAVYFKNNFWHYVPNWEHLIQRRTVWPGPFPFGGPVYGGDAKYSTDMLPASDRVLEKLIVMPVFLKTDADRIQVVVKELEAAAEQLL